MTETYALPADRTPQRRRQALRSVALGLLLVIANAGLAQAAAPGGGLAAAASTRHRVIAPDAPASLNLFHSDGFRYQDPNYSACVSTAVMGMLNFIALRGNGGPGFIWKRSIAAATRDSILTWARKHDTLAGGSGTDPHGWRNALNRYGWGTGALLESKRVYEDVGYSSFDRAMRAAVRAMILTRKPVGVLAWRGRHAQMVTGYYGLQGDPFKKTSTGAWADDFRIGGFYVTDPLRSASIVNRRISWTSFKGSTNSGVRFQPYYEYDSPYDDPYTAPDGVESRTEWYKRFVLIVPVR